MEWLSFTQKPKKVFLIHGVQALLTGLW
ncbi:hypothetical protein [Thermocrinis sp.]